MADDYRIGNPSYDADFDFVQSYVHYVKNEASQSEIKSLHLGYVSLLYKYLDKLERYLAATQKHIEQEKLDWEKHGVIMEYAYGTWNYRPEEMAKLPTLLLEPESKRVYEYYHSNPVLRELLYEAADNEGMYNILDKKDEYFAQARKHIEVIEKEFNIKQIQKAFLFISNMFCFYDPPERYVKNPSLIESDNPNGQIYFDEQFCYLPNDTGLFGLNTYLYAYFQDIDIVGVPSRYQNFDDQKNKCPSIFIKHDYFHFKSISRGIRGADKEFAHALYKTILNDGNLSSLQVELHVMVMWIFIHEFNEINSKAYSSLDRIKTLNEDRLYTVLATEFFEEMNRFRELVIDEEIVSSYIRNFGTQKPLLPSNDISLEASLSQTSSQSSAASDQIESSNLVLLDKNSISLPIYQLRELNPVYLSSLSAYYDDKSVDDGQRAGSLLKLIMFYHMHQVRVRYSG